MVMYCTCYVDGALNIYIDESIQIIKRIGDFVRDKFFDTILLQKILAHS